MEKIAFRVEGMTCDHCALTIEKTLLKNPNVISARVSYARGAGEIEVKEPASFEELQKEVHEEGYELFPGDPASFGGPDVSSDTSLRHIVIIGAGSGAFAAALRASELGARVTLVERGTIGGTCVNVGCVPSKILIRQAHHVHQSMCPPFEGIRPTTPEFSAPLLKKQREGRVLELREEKYSRLLRDLPNVTFIEGTASFQSETVVLVQKKDGTKHREMMNGGQKQKDSVIGMVSSGPKKESHHNDGMDWEASGMAQWNIHWVRPTTKDVTRSVPEERSRGTTDPPVYSIENSQNSQLILSCQIP